MTQLAPFVLFSVLSLFYVEYYASDLSHYIVLPLLVVVLVTSEAVWYYIFGYGKNILVKTSLKASIKIAMIGLVVFSSGFGIRFLDPVICYSKSFFQMHALFHVVVAFGLFLVYVMARKQIYNIFLYAKDENEGGNKSSNAISLEMTQNNKNLEIPQKGIHIANSSDVDVDTE